MSLKRAMKWAEAGWNVFPVRENKKPYFSDWETAASTKKNVIEGWWASVPDAKVGVVAAMAGCFVLDVDMKNGHDGNASLAKLEQQYDFQAYEYPQQDTPSGGRHLFMRGQYPTTVGTLGDGLDTRGGLLDGSSRGYVLAYTETPPATPLACPDGPDFKIAPRTERSDDTVTPLVEYDLDTNIERARKYLSTISPASEGGRNAALFKIAATVKDLGIGLEICSGLILEFPSSLGEPPIEDFEEIERTIQSAYENGQAQPGQSAINPATIIALAREESVKQGVKVRKRLFTWPEMRDKAEPPWIIRDLIPGRALVGMYGPGGSYKSFVAVDMALAIATGHLDWGGKDILTHGPVVVISGEGSQGPRVRAWERANAKVGDNFAVLDGMDLSDASDVKAAAEEIELAQKEKWHGTKPALLVVDTLARASGSADENSNKDMGRVVAACSELQRHFACTVLLVHHTPKAKHEWRGASAVWNALDAGLAVRRSDKKAVVEVERMKDGDTGQKFTCTLVEKATGRERDGVPEASLVVSKVVPEKNDGAAIKKARKVAQEQELRGRLLTAVRSDAARSILSDLLPGQTIKPATLAKQVAALLGPQADAEGTRAFLNRATLKTAEGKGLNTDHPLADCVVTLEPLAFGAPTEKGAEIAPDTLPD